MAIPSSSPAPRPIGPKRAARRRRRRHLPRRRLRQRRWPALQPLSSAGPEFVPTGLPHPPKHRSWNRVIAISRRSSCPHRPAATSMTARTCPRSSWSPANRSRPSRSMSTPAPTPMPAGSFPKASCRPRARCGPRNSSITSATITTARTASSSRSRSTPMSRLARGMPTRGWCASGSPGMKCPRRNAPPPISSSCSMSRARWAAPTSCRWSRPRCASLPDS